MLCSAFNKLKIVGVMGSGRKAWPEYSVHLGAEIAKQGCHLLTGGGSGVMKSVSRGFCSIAEREGHSLGIIPMNSNETSFVPHNKYPNPYVEIPIMTPLGVYDPENPEKITRNHVNILTSDIVIALPGMGGTRNEISLAQKFNKPLLLFGPMTEFQDLPEDINRAENLSQARHWLEVHIK